MFKNSGPLCFVVAIIVFIVGTIASIISGIAMISAAKSPFIGIAIIVGGILGTYLTCVIISAIGESAENSNKIVYEMDEMKAEIQKLKKTIEQAEANGFYYQGQEPLKTNEKETQMDVTTSLNSAKKAVINSVYESKPNGEVFRCGQCGYTAARSNGKCPKCNGEMF